MCVFRNDWYNYTKVALGLHTGADTLNKRSLESGFKKQVKPVGKLKGLCGRLGDGLP